MEKLDHGGLLSFWLSISRVADVSLWFYESIREESVDGFLRLIE